MGAGKNFLIAEFVFVFSVSLLFYSNIVSAQQSSGTSSSQATAPAQSPYTSPISPAQIANKCSAEITDPTGCLTKTDCENAKATWCVPPDTGSSWCTRSSCPFCEKNQAYYCKDEASCAKAGNYWCVDKQTGKADCSNYQCPTYACSKQETEYCKNKDNCVGAGAVWCGDRCETEKCFECDKNTRWGCKTEELCKSIGGYWENNNYCQDTPNPKCSREYTELCKTENECKSAGGNWFGNKCSKCAPDKPSWCYTKSDCLRVGADWCKSEEPSAQDGKSSVGEKGSPEEYNPEEQDGQCTTKGFCPKECPRKQVLPEKPKCSQHEYLSSETDADGCITSYYCNKISQCKLDDDVVCGSDGGNYINECIAKELGTTIRHKGNCISPTSCGEYISNEIKKKRLECANKGEKAAAEFYGDGCPNPQTAKCIPFVHKCKDADQSKAKTICEQSGGVFSVDMDAFGCANARCVGGTGRFCARLSAEEMEGMKSECSRHGGVFSTRDVNGCAIQDCSFTLVDNIMAGKQEKPVCPTEEENGKMAKACETIGLKANYIFMFDCKLVRCAGGPAACSADPEDEIFAQEKCGKEKTIKKLDMNGCQYFQCGAADQCDKDISESARAVCGSRGGTFFIKNQKNGCIDSATCLEPGASPDRIEVEPVKSVPDQQVLVNIAAELGEVKAGFGRILTGFAGLKKYYESIGNEKEIKRFKVVSETIKSASDVIGKIELKLKDKLPAITTDDLTEIKSQISFVKDALLKDALYTLLGKQTESQYK